MSILIKGINVKEIKRGAVAIVNIDNVVTFVHGDDIVVIPDHGDLIDRGELMREFARFVRRSNNSDFAPTPNWNDAVSLVGSAPVVIPAERSEE